MEVVTVAAAVQGRPLGDQEQIFHGMHQLGALIPLQVLHIRGPLQPDQVRAGLNWLQQQHPLLRAHIRYGRSSFRGIPPFLYKIPAFSTEGTTAIALRVTDEPWEEVLAEEARNPLPKDNSPRLRACFVRDRHDPELTHLILMADHATIDAQSIALASRELLTYLADPAALRTQSPKHTALPPALETGLPPRSDSGKPWQPPIRLPNREVPRERPATRVVTRKLDAETTARLKAAAKAKGTTLHATISAAFLMAIGDEYQLDDLTLLSTLDLRRMCRPALPADTYGCYVDILRTRHKLGSDFWAVARDVAFRLISAIAKDHQVASTLKVPSWSRYRTQTIPMLTRRRRIDCLTVTTAGDSGLGRHYGPLELEDVTMAVSLDFFGPTMMVIARERDGALDLSVNYSSRILPKETVSKIADAAVRTLVGSAV